MRGSATEKVAIVTGASTGIGLEIARGLVKEGYRVVLAVRDVEKGERAAKEIGGGEVMRLDLADLASVREFAAKVQIRHLKIHLLVNNAGIHTARREVTKDGFERTFQTNHLGHFLLTRLLLDALKRGAPSRIVNVASEAHRGGTLRLDDLRRFPQEPEDKPRPAGRGGVMGERWSGIRAYTQSKLANIMFTYALARRLEGTGVTAVAAHPGTVRTGWARGAESGLLRLVVAAASPFLISPAQGARTPLKAALDPAVPNGAYLVRRKVARSTRESYDVEKQEALWRASEEIVLG